MSVTVRRIFAPNLMPERRYTISELLSIAEEQTEEAKRALEAGEPDAVERVQQWSDTLEGLRLMKERGVPDSLKDPPENVRLT